MKKKIVKVSLFLMAVLICLSSILFFIAKPISISATSVKNNTVYSNQADKARIIVEDPNDQCILLVYTKSGNDYYVQKSKEGVDYYNISKDSNFVDIDADIKNDKSIYVAIVNKSFDLSKCQKINDETAKNLNINLSEVKVIPYQGKIITPMNLSSSGYYIKNAFFTLDIPEDIDSSIVKTIQWRCNDDNWQDYVKGNQISIKEDCKLSARFIDNNGIASQEETIDINNILSVSDIKVDSNEALTNNFKSNEPVNVSFKLSDEDIKKVNNDPLYINCYQIKDNTLKFIGSKVIDTSKLKENGTANCKLNFINNVESTDTESIKIVKSDNEEGTEEEILFIPDFKEEKAGTSKVISNIDNIAVPLNDKIYFDERAPKVSDYKLTDGDKNEGQTFYLKNEQDINLSISFQDVSDIDLDNAKINGQSVKLQPIDQTNRKFTTTIKATKEYNTDKGIIVDFNFKDVLGNINNKSERLATVRLDLTEPTVSNIAFEKDESCANNNDKVWAKAGDKIKVSFDAVDSESGVDYTKSDAISLSIGNDEKTLQKVDENSITNDGNGHYVASIKLNDDIKMTGTNICYQIKCNDRVGNTCTQAGDTNLKYDGEAPKCNNIKIEKLDNTANKSLIKNGESFKVTLDLSDANSGINDDSVKIKLSNNDEVSLKKSVSGSSSDIYEYSGEFTVNGGNDKYIPKENSCIDIESVKFSDNAGNENIDCDSQDKINKLVSTEKIKYYAPIENLNESVVSTNKVTSVAKNGDFVLITFKATHPVRIKGLTFEGESMEHDGKNLIVSADEDLMQYEIKYKVQGKTNDFDFINFALIVYDDALNDEVTIKNDDSNNIKYVAPIEVKNINVSTNNKNDGTKYAKNDDVITIVFETNHETRISDKEEVSDKNCAFIEGEKVQLSDDNYYSKYTITKKISGNIEDCSEIPIEFYISDIASNDLIHVTKDYDLIKNKIQYFKPIDINVQLETGGTDSGYVKNGDSISLKIDANHDIKVDNFNISGINGIKEDLSYLASQVLTYSFENNDTIIPEGELTMQASMSDVAGNEKTMDQIPRSIIYDRTMPKASVLPDFSGFTNKDIGFSAVFEDTNINPQALSLTVNSKEQFSDDEKAQAIANKSITKTLNISDEGEYSLHGTLTDMADNKCQSDIDAKIIVDKTNPTVTVTKLNSEKTPAFKKGFVIADHLNIDERYLNSIVCKVSDSSGAEDYDVSEPLETDGKKTISVVAQDMADNSSDETVFDVYIDDTAPKAIIKDNDSDLELKNNDSDAKFDSKMNLSCSLKDLSVGDEKPDKFTKLQIVDDKDNMVCDLISDNGEDKGSYSYMVDKIGNYKVIAEAIDSVGNETGEMIYPFEIKDMSITEEVYDNKPVFYVGIALIIVLGITGIGAIIVIISKSNKKKNDLREE